MIYTQKNNQLLIDPKPGERRTQIIDDFDSFNQLGNLWVSSNCELDSPIQDFIWSQTYLESICADNTIYTIIHKLGESIALAPLVQGKGILSPLKMIGVETLYEPMDFLYTDVSVLEALFEILQKLGHAICLERLPVESKVIPVLQKIYKGRALVHITPANACPYIVLSEDWLQPEKQFNSGRRSDFRRAQRNAERMGKITYEIVSPSPSETDSLLTEAFQVEARSWKGKTGTDLITDKPRGDFYRKYALKASQHEILRLCFLRIGGQAVAMQIAIEHDSRFWLLKVGYDEKFSRCSAGNLLMLHTIQYAAQKGLRSYEFLGTAEPWTKVWTDLVRPCVRVSVYPFNLSGSRYFITDAAKFVFSQSQQFWRSKVYVRNA